MKLSQSLTCGFTDTESALEVKTVITDDWAEDKVISRTGAQQKKTYRICLIIQN